jgi:hypothetical protein
MNGKKAKMLRKVAEELSPMMKLPERRLYKNLKKDYIRRKGRG